MFDARIITVEGDLVSESAAEALNLSIIEHFYVQIKEGEIE
jgi:hypothetical protein